MADSVLQRYGIGRVAENKALNSKDILVVPIEQTPVLDGTLKSNPITLQAAGSDADGKAYQVSAISDTTVTATWYPDSANRVSAPDVRRGERVELYRFADQDKFYWKEMGMDAGFRRQETVTHVYNNNADPTGADTTDLANSYYHEVSTHTGTITVGTGKSNGEPVAFTIQINAKAGVINIVGDNGLAFSLDAVAQQILAELSTGTKVDMDGNNLSMYAVDTLSLEAKNTINLTAPQINMVATTGVKATTPMFEITGVMKSGSIETTTDDGGTGKATIASAVTITETLDVLGTLTAEKIVTPNDIDAPNV